MEGEDIVTAALGNIALFGATLGIFAAFSDRTQRLPLARVNIHIEVELEPQFCLDYLQV